jgi:hypothetical protein
MTLLHYDDVYDIIMPSRELFPVARKTTYFVSQIQQKLHRAGVLLLHSKWKEEINRGFSSTGMQLLPTYKILIFLTNDIPFPKLG